MISCAVLGISLVFDNLKVVQRMSPPLNIAPNLSGNSIVQWADSTLTLQGATNAAGPYTDISSGSPYSVPAGNTMQFFRTRW